MAQPPLSSAPNAASSSTPQALPSSAAKAPHSSAPKAVFVRYLDGIPGLGPETRSAIYDKYRTIEKFHAALSRWTALPEPRSSLNFYLISRRGKNSRVELLKGAGFYDDSMTDAEKLFVFERDLVTSLMFDKVMVGGKTIRASAQRAVMSALVSDDELREMLSTKKVINSTE